MFFREFTSLQCWKGKILNVGGGAVWTKNFSKISRNFFTQLSKYSQILHYGRVPFGSTHKLCHPGTFYAQKLYDEIKCEYVDKKISELSHTVIKICKYHQKH